MRRFRWKRAFKRTARAPARVPRGRLVTVEGIDGSGKSTFARALALAMAQRLGRRVELTAEPTKTWLGETVRRALASDEPPLVDALLFMADHAAHVPRVRHTLARGVDVVSDRWSDSTFAYQGAALAGEVPRAMAWLRAAERPIDLTPDVTFLLDIPVQQALERMRHRPHREKFEHAAFLRKVRKNYLTLARQRRFIVLDARRPLDASVDDAIAHLARPKTHRKRT